MSNCRVFCSVFIQTNGNKIVTMRARRGVPFFFFLEKIACVSSFAPALAAVTALAYTRMRDAVNWRLRIDADWIYPSYQRATRKMMRNTIAAFATTQ